MEEAYPVNLLYNFAQILHDALGILRSNWPALEVHEVKPSNRPRSDSPSSDAMWGSYFRVPSVHQRVAVDLFANVHYLPVKRIIHIRLPKFQQLEFS